MAETRSRRTLAGVLAVFLLASLIVVLPTRRAESAGGDPIAPEYGALLGVWGKPKDGDWTKAGIKDRFNRLQSYAGRGFDIGHYYYGFTKVFPSWRESWHRDNGRVGYISWDAVPSAQIKNGAHDSTIRARADSVKAFGDPLLIRYAWEMAEGVNHQDAGTPSDFIAAWRRIVNTFRDRGADNAQFVWCPTAWSFHTGGAQQYYPGDAYVDWICADGYNWAPGKSGTDWRSFEQIYEKFYAWAEPHGKPLMVGEFGVQERQAGDKANWFRQVVPTLESKYPAIKALVYYDSDKAYPWWIDSSSSSIAGFKDMAQDPYLNRGLAFESTIDNGLADFATAKNVQIDSGQGADSGAPSLKADGTNTIEYVQANLSAGYESLCVAVEVKVTSLATSTTLIRFQNTYEHIIGRLYVTPGTRELWVLSDATGQKRSTGATLPLGTWHNVELCGTIGSSGSWRVYLNGSKVLDWQTANGAWRVSQFRLGQSGKGTFLVRFDDVVAQAAG